MLVVVETDEPPGLVKAPDIKEWESKDCRNREDRRGIQRAARAAGLCKGVGGISKSAEVDGFGQRERRKECMDRILGFTKTIVLTLTAASSQLMV